MKTMQPAVMPLRKSRKRKERASIAEQQPPPPRLRLDVGLTAMATPLLRPPSYRLSREFWLAAVQCEGESALTRRLPGCCMTLLLRRRSLSEFEV